MVAHALLGLLREFAEAGFALQRALLLLDGEIPVAVHPLGEMLLIPWRLTGSAAVRLRPAGLMCLWRRRSKTSALLTGEGRRYRKIQSTQDKSGDASPKQGSRHARRKENARG
ncbi:hypothetical protein GRAN_0499 [Granulicella sibirica]|uniref:Uncharacterized protein n=1 Tax=Granulicella sibirica TaxID=2479048 RepID=A0A4Q0T595_9BACT|nr:hypothetical protein GRAN_0499 [Granulicella sibirica]